MGVRRIFSNGVGANKAIKVSESNCQWFEIGFQRIWTIIRWYFGFLVEIISYHINLFLFKFDQFSIKLDQFSIKFYKFLIKLNQLLIKIQFKCWLKDQKWSNLNKKVKIVHNFLSFFIKFNLFRSNSIFFQSILKLSIKFGQIWIKIVATIKNPDSNLDQKFD